MNAFQTSWLILVAVAWTTAADAQDCPGEVSSSDIEAIAAVVDAIAPAPGRSWEDGFTLEQRAFTPYEVSVARWMYGYLRCDVDGWEWSSWDFLRTRHGDDPWVAWGDAYLAHADLDRRFRTQTGEARPGHDGISCADLWPIVRAEEGMPVWLDAEPLLTAGGRSVDRVVIVNTRTGHKVEASTYNRRAFPGNYKVQKITEEGMHVLLPDVRPGDRLVLTFEYTATNEFWNAEIFARSNTLEVTVGGPAAVPGVGGTPLPFEVRELAP